MERSVRMSRSVQLAAGSALAAGLIAGALSTGAGFAVAQPPGCPPGQNNCGHGGGPGGPGGPDNHGGPGGPDNHGGQNNGWHPAPPPPLPGGRHDAPPPAANAPDWGWGPGQGYVPQWASMRPNAPWWAPGARVYWSQERNAWGFWWGWPLGFWFPA
jgi:hypothetical protein